MIIAAWILLAALTCCASSLNAPIAAAMDQATHDSSQEDETMNIPDKRILKYLLPSSQNWGVDSPIPTGQEGSKRGYSNDRSFLRFGRSDAAKRYGNKNFLRFGRGDIVDYEEEGEDVASEPSAPLEKRNRNFLRFGRDPARSYLRFGRGDNMEQQIGVEGSPLAFAQGLTDDEEPIEEDKRAGAYKSYLRFGRGNRNFLRFGRVPNKNFIRFGRSVDTQTFCDDCQDEENQNKHLSSQDEESKTKQMSSSEHSEDASVPSSAAARDTNAHRAKRSAAEYFDYATVPSHGPISWARDYQPAEDEVEDSDLDEIQEINKRNSNRNFLRFGRDRSFLRFGKRDTPDSSSGTNTVMVTPIRVIRTPARSFLRFG